MTTPNVESVPIIHRPTRGGQPRMGSKLTLGTTDGSGPLDCRVVGKLFGSGGKGNLIGIIVEAWNTEVDGPGRTTLEWPLVRTGAS